MALSYLDKAIIFLLPLLVFQFFQDQKVYVSIEYIYSVTTVIIPLIDLGLSGYFFYAYRNSENRNVIISFFIKCFQRLYLVISCVGLVFITIHYFGFGFEPLIVFIVARLLFVLATAFFASYYRLTNKPEKAVYITLFSNILSLSFLLAYFVSGLQFSLWLVFIGQILFSTLYFLKSIIDVFFRGNQGIETNEIKSIFLKALMFSWPSIIQVFVAMGITNFGKINMFTKMNLEDGVLLSLIQRFSMIIFLTHSSVWAFILKDLYVDKNLLTINKHLFYKYLMFLLLAFGIVLFVTEIYILKNYINVFRTSCIALLIIGQTFFACIFAYLEMYYGRENKNIIKLYLALFNALVFLFVLMAFNLDFLERISLAMFISTFTSLLLSVFVLYKRNYNLA
ncbi:hypothetical protein VQ01_09310 [Tamlana sp. s12]|nr:hypothetical protein VQ01_09310 [Tamlana sp. s12]